MILRFPGAKTKLLPILRPYIDRLVEAEDCFCDPFIGSGAVLLDTARRYPHLRLHANDADSGLIAFWSVVAGRSVAPLCDRIFNTRPTLRLFKEVLASKPTRIADIAFKFYFLNRTSFSGLWRGGPIGGYSQRGRWKVDVGWRPEKSVTEIRDANVLLKGRLTLTCMSGNEYVRRNLSRPCFIDPPYFGPGDRLYPHRMTLAEHVELARLLRKANGWVLTLDDNPVVRQLYCWACVHVVPARYHLETARRRRSSADELVITPA